MGLMSRTADLHLYAPPDLLKIIQLQLDVADTQLPYTLHFHPLLAEGIIMNESKMTVTCFKVNHRIECWGFLFREKKNPRRIDPARVKSYEIPAAYYEALQKGEDYINKKGTIIPNTELTVAAVPAKSYAYCADTLFDESIIEKVQNVDLLYHEATYLKDLHQRAKERYHSTTEEAATIALKAAAKKLIIGHFSSKYDSLDAFLEETCCIFQNTELAIEGASYIV